MSKVLCSNPGFLRVFALDLWDTMICVINGRNETVVLTLMVHNCCDVLLVIWFIQRVLMVTVIIFNITLIHVYNPALPGHILLHLTPHIRVSNIQDVIFEAIVLTTLFGPPTKSLAQQVALHRTYSIAHAQ